MGFLFDFVLEPFLLALGKTYKPDEGLYAISATPGKVESTSKANTSDVKGKKGKQDAPSKKNKSGQRVQDWEKDWGLSEWDEDVRPGGMAHIKRNLKMEVVNLLPEKTWQGFVTTRKSWREDKTFHLGRNLKMGVVNLLPEKTWQGFVTTR